MTGFPGANADRGEATYAVVGAPLDATTSFRPGTRFGADRVRQFARGFEDYDHHTELRFSDIAIHDHGDVRAWNAPGEYVDHLTSVLREFRQGGAVPLLVGGEHTVSVAGVRATDPDVFVCLDAHLDLRTDLDGDEWSHATATRHALETAEEAVILGARAGSETEWDRAGRGDVTVVPPAEVPAWKPAFEGEAYLSVDVDAADPAVAPGTGTPEPFGLDAATMRDVVRSLAPRAVGFDVVEVNDRDHGEAALLAAKLLRAFVFSHASEE
ncbi:MAG: arginase family protein [Halobacteriales archaeon]